MSFQNLISELKRRRVFRVAGVYAVAAWIAIQVADTVLPRLGAPDWTVTFIIVLAALGFIVAIGLAWAFDLTGDGIQRTSGDATAVSGPAPRHVAWLAAVVLAMLLLGWFFARASLPKATELDAKLIAVMPFRVGGAPGAAYLREGMLDLLANTLVANDGTHVVDPATTMLHWHKAVTNPAADLPADSARAVARSMGAAHLVLGSVTGAPAQLTVTIDLINTANGDVTRSRAEGSADSISKLVDQIAAQIMTATAGEASDRASLLAGVPLPAIRAYLDGVKAMRAGHADEAAQQHAAAFAIDSTFVLAAIGVDMAVSWGGSVGPGVFQRARGVMWANRDRLPPVDRAYVTAVLGTRHPLPSSGAERLAAAREMHRLAPERIDTRFMLADYLFHYGRALGVLDAHEQAKMLIDGVLETDPDLAFAAVHRVQLAFAEGDSATVNRLADGALARDSTDEAAAEMRWFSGALRGDTALLTRLVRQWADSANVVFAFAYHSFSAGVALEHADAAVDAYGKSPGLRSLTTPFSNAMNRGRMSHARDVLADVRMAGDSTLRRMADVHAVTEAAYAGYDSVDAGAAATRLEQWVNGGADPARTITARCALAHWGLAQGRYDKVTAAITGLRAVRDSANPLVPEYGALCADFLNAKLAVQRSAANARVAVQRIDSLLARVPENITRRDLHMMNFAVAHMYDELGDPAAALKAVRRRMFYLGDLGAFLAPSRLLEARLADANGDRAGALAAYRHYLALTDKPEPAFAENVAFARRELQRLTAER